MIRSVKFVLKMTDHFPLLQFRNDVQSNKINNKVFLKGSFSLKSAVNKLSSLKFWDIFHRLHNESEVGKAFFYDYLLIMWIAGS